MPADEEDVPSVQAEDLGSRQAGHAIVTANDEDPADVECDSGTAESCRLHVRSLRDRESREVEDLRRVQRS
eukprot:CAMPEP_0184250416 /NCGR_PEP_ID=MMETSP0977-20130417/4555_1 /TAXON_ID=483370 /ORGANISM="non described non described, Strain CCMP2097" /LENGTH=70 /DNA_ID=CAMNT_0026555835 /DNA_START=85 /DNA_END=294 /DNA_ORIENTATION=-